MSYLHNYYSRLLVANQSATIDPREYRPKYSLATLLNQIAHNNLIESLGVQGLDEPRSDVWPNFDLDDEGDTYRPTTTDTDKPPTEFQTKINRICMQYRR